MNVLEHLQQKVIIPLHLFGFDCSLTNGAISLWVAVLLSFALYFFAARNLKSVPGRLQNMAEILIVFLQEEVASQINKNREKWLPFLVALFTFILMNNLISLVPGMGSATANINTTAALAIMVFIIVQINGVCQKGFIGYLRGLVPSGLPLPITLFMIPIELVSQVAKPFSLALRLFANMYAGHAVMLLIISLIFIFRNNFIIPLPVIGNAVILVFEIFVGFIQAFIFTYLSALYIETAQEGH